jgi:hypothetical protein
LFRAKAAPSAANGFAGDAVAVAVHFRAVAGLAGVERRLARCADFVAAGIIDALLDLLALLARLERGGRTRRPALTDDSTKHHGSGEDFLGAHFAMWHRQGCRSVKPSVANPTVTPCA